MGNCDPYSDSPEPAVVKQPQSTRVKEPTLLCNQVPASNEMAAFALNRNCRSELSNCLQLV
jgi:hypothetical protein